MDVFQSFFKISFKPLSKNFESFYISIQEERETNFQGRYKMKNKETIDVMFRKFQGEILAIFPHTKHHTCFVLCYTHSDQHLGADYNGVVYNSRPAKEEEYRDLKKELEKIGYNLKIVHRRNIKKVQ